MNLWVIRGPAWSYDFWSNEQGWVEHESDARVFRDDEKSSFCLPLYGNWQKLPVTSAPVLKALSGRLALMNRMAEAFEREATWHQEQIDLDESEPNIGPGRFEVLRHHVNARDDLRRSARTNREDAQITAELLHQLSR